VQVVQVDVVHAEPEQRRLAGPLDVAVLAPVGALAVAGAAVDAELGGQLDLVAAAGDGPADQDLVVAGPVNVGGVDEGDAEVQGPADGGDRLVPVGPAVELAHPHAAEALRGDGELAKGN